MIYDWYNTAEIAIELLDIRPDPRIAPLADALTHVVVEFNGIFDKICHYTCYENIDEVDTDKTLNQIAAIMKNASTVHIPDSVAITPRLYFMCINKQYDIGFANNWFYTQSNRIKNKAEVKTYEYLNYFGHSKVPLNDLKDLAHVRCEYLRTHICQYLAQNYSNVTFDGCYRMLKEYMEKSKLDDEQTDASKQTSRSTRTFRSIKASTSIKTQSQMKTADNQVNAYD